MICTRNPLRARPASRAFSRPFLLAFGVLVLLVLARFTLPSPSIEASHDGAAEKAETPEVALSEAAPTSSFVPPTAVTSLRSHRWNERVLARIEDWIEKARRASPAIKSKQDIRVSVCVRDLETGDELCGVDASRPFVPASNMKLVTTAAALVLLGHEMEFVTGFDAVGRLTDGDLEGDLVIRAGGDPLVSRGSGFRVEAPLQALAAQLAGDGLRRVRGDLVLDEGDFATPGPAPGWPDASQHWASYCALSGGFSINGGVIDAIVDAGAAGSKAKIRVSPAAHGLTRRYDVDTVSKGGLDVRVGATKSGVTVRGKLPSKVGHYEADFAHFDPVLLFGEVLRSELEAAGIRIDGSIVRGRNIERGKPLATLHSALVDVLEPINADSDNGVADQVFLTLGHLMEGSGTREGGEAATRRGLERLGVSSEGFVQVDGSGLSRDNRVSARQVVSLLGAVMLQEARTAKLYRSSLAVAGQRGTLEDRMEGTAAEGRVFAKTGWIAGASALSGFLETVEGRRLAFSILVEYPRGAGGLNRSVFKPMQDALATSFVEEAP